LYGGYPTEFVPEVQKSKGSIGDQIIHYSKRRSLSVEREGWKWGAKLFGADGRRQSDGNFFFDKKSRKSLKFFFGNYVISTLY
jgi:hypothetical protein